MLLGEVLDGLAALTVPGSELAPLDGISGQVIRGKDRGADLACPSREISHAADDAIQRSADRLTPLRLQGLISEVVPSPLSIVIAPAEEPPPTAASTTTTIGRNLPAQRVVLAGLPPLEFTLGLGLLCAGLPIGLGFTGPPCSVLDTLRGLGELIVQVRLHGRGQGRNQHALLSPAELGVRSRGRDVHPIRADGVFIRGPVRHVSAGRSLLTLIERCLIRVELTLIEAIEGTADDWSRHLGPMGRYVVLEAEVKNVASRLVAKLRQKDARNDAI